MTDPTKAKIIELVPEIVELKEGCEILVGEPKLKHVIYGHDDDEGTWYGYLAKPFPVELEENSYYDIEIDDEALHNVEILGRPITLADVLRAIPVGVYMKSLGEQVRFVSYDADMEEHAGLEYWDLLSDYDGQTQEVKEFIGKLLGV